MEAAFYCTICSCKILPIEIGFILNCRIRYIVVGGNAPPTAICRGGCPLPASGRLKWTLLIIK